MARVIKTNRRAAAPAPTDNGKAFWGSATGRWAGERFLAALNAGRQLSANDLRTLDTLQKDEWKAFDDAVVAESVNRMVGVADVMSAGNVIRIANGLGKTVLEYNTASDMGVGASISLDGMAKSEDDQVTFGLNNLPLPITHKDFMINIRTLIASRERGEPLDTMEARISGRLVSEAVESMLFAGGPTFGGMAIYGLTNHPSRNLDSFGTNGHWDAAAKTGEDIMEDVLSMKALAAADGFYGPFNVYIPTAYDTPLDDDYKANSDLTIRQRVLQVNGINAIGASSSVPADTVVLVQMTPDVVSIVEGMPLQTIQWDIEGGMAVRFKAATILVPLVRATKAGKSGVVVMT